MAKKNSQKNEKRALAVAKFVVVTTLFVLLGLLLYNSTRDFLYYSPIFRVKRVVKVLSLRYIDDRYLSNIVGRSIFEVDLNRLHNKLLQRYPELQDLRVIRKFPNRIYLLAQRRTPVALAVVSGRMVVIDDEGTCIGFDKPASSRSLISLLGMKSRRAIILGRQLRGDDIAAGLSIINAFQEEEDLKAYQLLSIDVTHLSRINMVLSGNVQVLLDTGDVTQSMRKLGILLSEGKLDLTQIEYIDLRFREPILGKKKF